MLGSKSEHSKPYTFLKVLLGTRLSSLQRHHGEQTTSVQRMLQATSHRHRLALVADVVEQERRRIAARRALKSLFGDSR